MPNISHSVRVTDKIKNSALEESVSTTKIHCGCLILLQFKFSTTSLVSQINHQILQLQLTTYSVKNPLQKNNNNNNNRNKSKTSKHKNRKTKLTIAATTIITTRNTQTYTQSQASYSLQHILHRRYYLSIAQMTSTRKAYIPSLLA